MRANAIVGLLDESARFFAPKLAAERLGGNNCRDAGVG
jgi:hypothetical protein